MSFRGQKKSAAFTLVELMIGMSLALIIMTAMLSSFTYLGRSFTRLMGVGSLTQPNMEAQGRRTLAYFMQDVGMANGLSVTSTDLLSATQCTLIIPTGTSSKKITYYFNTTAVNVTAYNVTVKAYTLARIDRSNDTALTLHTNLYTTAGIANNAFTYYDTSGNPYTTYVNYLPGIKQIALNATAQAGDSANQTLGSIYQVASPRLLLRNKSLLP